MLSAFIRTKPQGKKSNAFVQLMGSNYAGRQTIEIPQKKPNFTTSTLSENRPLTTSSKWGFQWTKMLIHCQGGDILHMIGPCRLIKTSVQITVSFLKPLCGFPSPCFIEMSKKSIYHIYFLVFSKKNSQSLQQRAPTTCCYHPCPSTFSQVKTSRMQSRWWPYLSLVG